ncbi:peptidoglycan/LPS O-acetylase OafA/YrhL [Arcticibacter pallidicorallinus]|uniref:Peptidoglycan/LPS O-acetylase OafA/YrhL n=1 Tax=Arcticibacter pallidicorallinus TaxID=1259464 RepID=A0A2T0TUV9_9SPHI|nr:acyltransferase [Arcticibacter pallidicorallinus]PRY49447.1 peptidoglycan/LPS O-acetylase OafA/YrhL [Arcticibacter pallidicorallinus]
MIVADQTKYLTDTKRHFEILDGLRGVAALAVVIFHFMESITPDLKDNFIAHSYLAVDFFFCLSGFVIAYAYDVKFAKIGIANFLKLRLIRLHPLVIIGVVLGLICFMLDPFSSLFEEYSAKTVVMFITSCLMIPYPAVEERYFNLFHLNPPTWSLFWEYVANIFYALFLVKIRNKVLWGLVTIAAVLLCFEAIRSNNLLGGWGSPSVAAGGIRVFYSFLAGMLIYRMNWIIKNPLGFLPLSLLLSLAFLMPFVEKFNWLNDLVTVLFYFPLLIALGAGSLLKPAYLKVCRFSGAISYPLYMVHYPFLWVFHSYVLQNNPPVNEMIAITVVGVPLLVAFAYCIMAFVDVPVRKYLKEKFIPRREANQYKQGS